MKETENKKNLTKQETLYLALSNVVLLKRQDDSIDVFQELQNACPDFKRFVKKHESLTTEEIRKLYNI